ncbi:hypothetical protein GBF38_019715, partial [Nibea albiflora]
MSGRYGFFDPHPRTVKGLPLPLDSRAPGTGVMVTFTHLSDMIDRLIKYHKTLETNSSCNYELKPVAFVNLNDPKPVAFVNLNDPKPVAFVNLNDPKPVAFVNLNDPKPVAFVNLNDPNLDKTSQATTHTAAVSTFALDDNVLHDISRKLSKLGKQARRKYKRRLMLSEKVSQRKENQKRKEKVKYASNETYK